MKRDTTKHNIIITLYSDDVGKLINRQLVGSKLYIDGREIIIDYVACLQCQEKQLKKEVT